MERERVREELARIRQLSQNTEAVCCARERRKRRMELLKRTEDTAGEEVFSVFEHEIDEINDMEARYIAASGHFCASDRTILLEGLMGGKSYRTLGDQLGYSSENVRKRARRIIIKLSELL